MSRFLAVLAALLVLSCSAFAYGEPKSSTIQGITREPAGQPLAHAQVVLRSVASNTDRTVISGDDGAFTVENLGPGRYELTASKEGFGASSPTAVDLGAQQSLRVDVTLALSTGSKASGDSAANAPLTERERQLIDRLSRLEERLAAMEAKESKGSVTQATAVPTGPAPTVATQTAAAPSHPALVASLDPRAALPLAEKPNSVSIPPIAGTAPAAKPAAAAVQQPAAAAAPPEKPAPSEPFAFADWTWLNGTSRNHDSPLDSKYFTGEFRADTNYTLDFNHPRDDSLGGSTETFRSDEVQVEQISLGGDLHVGNARGRILTMFGMFSTTTPRNDPSTVVGQWDLRDAYRYVSEAWGGYHFNVNHGLNIDAGIFVSYIGLFSYYNFDNWAYQPSYVSSNTPWFFNGVRVQWFPTDKLKIEPWFINGWQSYARSNRTPGLGGQILYRPKQWLSFVFNNYGMGEDAPFNPGRSRIHTDDSVEVKYYDRPDRALDKMAFSFTGDLGCEYGGGVSCSGNHAGGPKQAFLGWMAYDRFQFKKDRYGITLGGGQMNNPGRYLTLLPPINGADAISGTPYFTENPGDQMKAWDSTVTFDYMPSQFVTFRFETGYRHSDVPYWTGRGGITPPGGNNGSPNQFACITGAASGAADLPTAEANCGGPSNVWFPDLRKQQIVSTVAVMVRF
ncbi:MAG: TonB-dependent receptor [Terriglobia bacterium]